MRTARAQAGGRVPCPCPQDPQPCAGAGPHSRSRRGAHAAVRPGLSRPWYGRLRERGPMVEWRACPQPCPQRLRPWRACQGTCSIAKLGATVTPTKVTAASPCGPFTEGPRRHPRLPLGDTGRHQSGTRGTRPGSFLHSCAERTSCPDVRSGTWPPVWPGGPCAASGHDVESKDARSPMVSERLCRFLKTNARSHPRNHGGEFSPTEATATAASPGRPAAKSQQGQRAARSAVRVQASGGRVCSGRFSGPHL